MRTILRTVLVTAVAVGIGVGCAATGLKAGKKEGESAPLPKEIALKPPRLDRPAPLMKALNERKSERNYSDRKLTVESLSDLLWAANGVNRPDGKRTSPSAMNKQGVDIYVVMEEGTFIYDAVKSVLVPAVGGDNRKAAGKQEFVAVVPLNLVYVVNTDIIGTEGAAIAVGCMAQNVGLYCATEGLGSVVRGWFDGDELTKALKLGPKQAIILTQSVGYPKQ